MKSRNFIAMAMLFFVNVAIAQLNESDTVKFQMRASLSGSWQKGNVDLLVVRGKADFVANGNSSLVFKSQISSLYQQFGSFKADNDINSRNYLYFKPQQSFYPFAMFFAQTNFRRKIEYRFFGGIGLTYNVVREANNILKLSASIIKEKTRFSSNQFNQAYYIGDNDIALWRATVYLSGTHKIAKNKLRLYYIAYWQPAFETIPNHRIQMDAGIEMPVWEGLSINAQYLFNYEQVVAEKIKQIDRIMVFGVAFQFKK